MTHLSTKSFMQSAALIMLIYSALFVVLLFITQNFKQQNNVFNISQLHFESKASERLETIYRFFNGFKPTLKSIESNSLFQNYILKGTDKAAVTETFLSIQKSLNCVSRISFIDASGNEQISVVGPATRYTPKLLNHSYSIPKPEMRNLADQPFFQEFIKLPSGEIGIYKIENSQAPSKEKASKPPMTRYGMPVYSQQKLKGILIIDVCLKDFLNLFSKTTLYHIYLMNNKGTFILHPENLHSLSKSPNHPLNVTDVFEEDIANQILKSQQYFDNAIYSQAFHINDNQQDQYYLLLKAKYSNASNFSLQSYEAVAISLVLALLLTLPVAYRLTRSQQTVIDKLDQFAHVDQLTQLPNKNSLLEDLQHHQQADIILISIDHFFELTKVYGYSKIDELIKCFAMHLNNYCAPNHCHSYHIGSERFVLLFGSTTEIDVSETLNSIKMILESKPLLASKHTELDITLSMGVAHFDHKHNTPLDTLLDAERSLFDARKMQYAFLPPDNNSLLTEQNDQKNIWLLQQIRLAVKDSSVEVHYQPMQNAQTGEVYKFEALMRLRDDQGKLLMPSEFMAFAKATQYYPQLSQQLICKTIETLSLLPKSVNISINLSAIDIKHPEVMNTLIAEATNRQVIQQLVLEVVESEDLGDLQEILQIAKTLHNLGFQLAIDDFGSGYANFQNIIQLAPYFSFLKLDGTIVTPCLHDTHYHQLIQSIIKMAKTLQLKTIAEFVENEAIQDELTKLGIDYHQGYHIGKPNAQVRID